MRSVTFYSDSMDVLWWVQGHGRSFGEIQMVTEPSQWQHVLTGENPADLCTRGATPDELLKNSLWWHGPKWLLPEDKASWPEMDIRSHPASLPEMKTSNRKKEVEDVPNVLTCRLQSLFNREGKGEMEPESEDWRLKPTRFSSWTQLVRLHARVWRVIFNMRSPNNSVKGQELLPEEIEDAEEEIISGTQLEAFPEEYMAFLKEKEIPKKSSLSKLYM